MSGLQGTKSAFASSGVIVGAIFGVEIDAETQALVLNQVTALITAASALFGAVVGIIGRIKATKKIG